MVKGIIFTGTLDAFRATPPLTAGAAAGPTLKTSPPTATVAWIIAPAPGFPTATLTRTARRTVTPGVAVTTTLATGRTGAPVR